MNAKWLLVLIFILPVCSLLAQGSDVFVQEYEVEELDKSSEQDDATFALKFNLSAYHLGSLSGSLEYALSDKYSIEAVIAGHGLGTFESDLRSKEGIGIELGFKKKLQSFFVQDYDFEHKLQGTYLKGILGFGSVNEREEQYFANGFVFNLVNRDYGYLGFDLGSQWTFANLISLDLYTGIVYYAGDFEVYRNIDGNEFYAEDDTFEDGDIFGDDKLGIKIGFRVGILFGKKGFRPRLKK